MMNSIQPNMIAGAAASTTSEQLALQHEGIELKDEGPIRLLHLPADWVLEDSFSVDDGNWSLKSFRYLDAELRVLGRGGIDAALLNVFGVVLSQQLEADSRALVPEEVKSLRNILGTAIGDNQYTNPNPKESRCAPTCHIIFAQVLEISLRRLMSVEGIFIDRNGKARNRFVDYFTLVDRTRVHEIMLQAPLDKFDLHHRLLRRCLNSIQWQPEG